MPDNLEYILLGAVLADEELLSAVHPAWFRNSEVSAIVEQLQVIKAEVKAGQKATKPWRLDSILKPYGIATEGVRLEGMVNALKRFYELKMLSDSTTALKLAHGDETRKRLLELRSQLNAYFGGNS